MAVRGARRVSGQSRRRPAAVSGSPEARRGPRGPIERLARRLAHRVLGGMRTGTLELTEAWSGETLTLGHGSPHVRVEVRSPSAYVQLARRRSVGFGLAYAAGLWEGDDLVGLCRLAAREVRRSDSARRRIAPLLRPVARLRDLPGLNTRAGAQRNI